MEDAEGGCKVASPSLHRGSVILSSIPLTQHPPLLLWRILVEYILRVSSRQGHGTGSPYGLESLQGLGGLRNSLTLSPFLPC